MIRHMIMFRFAFGEDARKSDVIKNDIKRMSHISAAHGGKSL